MTAGVFNVETAREMLQAFRQLQSSGLLRPGVLQALIRQPATTTTPIYVHNVSGETIPAYACMQVTGTEEIGDQNYLQVDKPADTDGTAGAFLFNSSREISDDENGIAQFAYHGVVRGYKNTGTVTAGDKWAPVANQWYIAEDASGIFTACGSDDVDTDVLKVSIDGGGGTTLSAFVTPGGGIAARSGSTLGSASCTQLTVSGGTRATTSNSATVYNLFTSAIGASNDIVAARINGIWVAIAEDC